VRLCAKPSAQSTAKCGNEYCLMPSAFSRRSKVLIGPNFIIICYQMLGRAPPGLCLESMYSGRSFLSEARFWQGYCSAIWLSILSLTVGAVHLCLPDSSACNYPSVALHFAYDSDKNVQTNWRAKWPDQ
jgi:hypothetical protein